MYVTFIYECENQRRLIGVNRLIIPDFFVKANDTAVQIIVAVVLCKGVCLAVQLKLGIGNTV